MQPIAAVGGHTLQRKVITIVVAGLALAFSVFGFLALEAVRQSTQSVFQERLMMARVTAAHIDLELKQALDYLHSVQSTTGLDLYDSDLEPKQKILAEIRARLPLFAQQVYLVDRSGTIVLTDPMPSPLLGVSIFDYAHVRRTLEGGRFEVSGVVLGPVFRKPEVALAVPIVDRAGRTIGVLGASVEIARASLSALILGLKPGQTGHTQILDGNGTVMASTNPDFVLHRSHHYDLLFSLMRQKSTTVVSHATEGSGPSYQEIVAFAPLSQASWGVSVEQSESEALAVGQDLSVRLLGLGFLSLLEALATCIVVLRRVLIPIESLTLASERIARGDLESPPLISGEDEVGRLARTFEIMRVRLKQSRDELDRWHKELELRVQQRTKELSCLFELSKTIASSTDLDDMVHAVVHKVAEVLGPADATYLYLEDPLSRQLVLRAWHGDLPDGQGDYYSAVAAVALDRRQPLHYRTAEAPHNLEEELREKLNGLGRALPSTRELGTVTCAPLLTQNRALGALLLRCPRAGEQDERADLPLVQALADQAAVAIERAQLAREAEQATVLREADRLKSMFISTITHELQSPLGFIKGYATTLLRPDTEFDKRTRREFLQIISEESDSLSALIDDLLDVSRLEAGALPMEKQPVSLLKLVRRAVSRVGGRSGLHHIVHRLPAGLPLVEADPRRLEQVLHNLLDNAIKYSPNEGTVTVSVTARIGSAVVSVADQGIGIPIDEQRKVFKRFYRAAVAPTVSRRGAGLGLSICRGIVEAHGGSIWLDSDPGRGTTVHFSLPLRTEDERLPRRLRQTGEEELPLSAAGKGAGS